MFMDVKTHIRLHLEKTQIIQTLRKLLEQRYFDLFHRSPITLNSSNMKTVQLFKTLSFIGLITLLFSCEKVIHLKLKQEEQRLVIEGVLTKGDSTHRVKITKTL